MVRSYSILITVAGIILPGRKWRVYHIMNSRDATKSLGDTPFDARGIVHEKIDENTPQKPHFLSVR
jgi:hypothetical protein